MNTQLGCIWISNLGKENGRVKDLSIWVKDLV